ncbi:lytic transglycosylase [Rhodoplanes elegans]|uniref:Lytic transglycosylase n=1 Tax=Rhodoplanes elegans TaxID=29408 RepID=A0A327KDA4_9BRAD|nr:transglycosylase SLT domain-containing protein [Rhodoplanes elegans]MBK5962118.1 lytic transglycosylase [Rhodoplanes elegans]RAI36074.1 lytic transglycosylase [Rhodoplanes elegans]
MRLRQTVSAVAIAALIGAGALGAVALGAAGPAHAAPSSDKTSPDKSASAKPTDKSKAGKDTKSTAKPTDKKADAKKFDAKKTDTKKADAKKPDPKKPDSKKVEAKTDSKKQDAKKPDAKKDAKASPPKAQASAKPAAGPGAPPRPLAPPSRSASADPSTPIGLHSAGATEAPETTAATAAYTPVSYTPAPSAGEALAYAPTRSTSSGDLSIVKQALAAARRGRTSDATELQASLSDPLAQKLVEWMILRANDNGVSFSRYARFVEANPTWPSNGMLRRRAENMLWTEKADPATVRAFFSGREPLGTRGKLVYARALMAAGDRAKAAGYVRSVWRTDSFGRDLEEEIQETFPGMITRADDKARMDRRLYEADDLEVAMRAANRLGGSEPSIAKARHAVNQKAGNAKALLDGLGARNDIGLAFSRIQWLRRAEHYQEAARIMLAIPRQLDDAHDSDEWWIERRLLARKLIELGDPKSAYIVCRDATPPEKENYQVEHEFMAGWIALRFLNDPATASKHFARIPATGVKNPISLSRAGYWLGRSAEAVGRRSEARAHYEQAARWSTAYYGQLARARLGLGEIALRNPPAMSADRRAAVARLEVVRAVEILYAIDERDLVIPFVADLADRTSDAAALTLIAEIAAKHDDARAVLLTGKTALGNGLPLDHAAFPTIGLPRYSPIGPEVEPAIVYAIARQESAFNPKTVSTANALGLMQVTPAAGRFIAKTHGVPFDQKRLLHDKVYNVQMGAAELGGNIAAYNGSYILAFAAYNAGRGRVKEWIERFGDPRDPNVDAVDWVERIPFSETRNYVQRIMENVQAYRVRFGGGTRLLIEADLKRGGSVN